MRRFFAYIALLTIILAATASCSDANTRETAITAALGPPEHALPYQAVFAIDASADRRLIAAAENFCDRSVSLSNGRTVFSLLLSKDALLDMREGRAELALLDGAQIPAFSAVSEAFRYKSYEHFSMTVNSEATLARLSDIADANVFAGFYTGSNVILSSWTLDSRFRPTRGNDENPQATERVPVAALSSETARAFSLLGADVTEEKSLDARISAFGRTYSAVELSSSELDSPALLQAIRTKNAESLEPEFSDGNANLSDNGESAESVPLPDEAEPFALTQAFTGIRPVWLVFAPSAYQKLSQTGRAVVAEAAAYMVTDIDRVYLEYEKKKIDAILEENIIISQDFNATRARALRLSDDAASSSGAHDKRLREAMARVS